MYTQIFKFSIHASLKRCTLAAVLSAAALTGVARAAAVNFTYNIAAGAAIFSLPTTANPAVSTTIVGTGSFSPFGAAIYSEAGIVTYTLLPVGIFVPVSVANTFVASFDGGSDTFSGLESVIFGPPNADGLPTFASTLSITGGTGVFSGATGSAAASGIAMPAGPPSLTQTTPLTFLGSGRITAPGLNATPEPASILLFASGLAATFAIRKKLSTARRTRESVSAKRLHGVHSGSTRSRYE